MTERLKKYDRPIIGVTVGTILPILGFLISYPIKGWRYTFGEYLDVALLDYNRLDVFILSMIPNMLLFYLTNFRWNLNEFTKGLVAVTILLVLMICIITVI
jgi:hypothetical protein